jgi:hypothetical protein
MITGYARNLDLSHPPNDHRPRPRAKPSVRRCLWVPDIRSPQAAWAYSWISPLSQSRRTTLPAGRTAADSTDPSGGAWPKARCGRCTLSWSASSASTNISCRPPKMSIRSKHLAADRAHPPLRIGVGPRRPHRCAQHLDPLGGNGRVERGGELGIPITDHKPEPATPSPISISRCGFWACWATRAPTGCGVTPARGPPGRHLDHKQHVQPLQQDRVYCEEVHRQHALGLGPQEPPPAKAPTAPVPAQPWRAAGWPTRVLAPIW